MKFFGHPLHVMLIHFPSALFPMDLFCSVAGAYFGAGSWADTSFFAMAGGVVLGALAIIAGGSDLLGIVRDRPELIKKVLLHGGINSLVVIGYSVPAFIAYQAFPHLGPDSLSKIIYKSTLVVLLLAGNYLGGSLILKDGVAVEKAKR